MANRKYRYTLPDKLYRAAQTYAYWIVSLWKDESGTNEDFFTALDAYNLLKSNGFLPRCEFRAHESAQAALDWATAFTLNHKP